MNFFENTNTQSDEERIIFIIMILLGAGFCTCLMSTLCGTIGYLIGRDTRENRTPDYDRLENESGNTRNAAKTALIDDILSVYETNDTEDIRKQYGADSLEFYGEINSENEKQEDYKNKNVVVKSSSDEEHPSYLEEQIKNKM
jgi:hypothetical protein